MAGTGEAGEMMKAAGHSIPLAIFGVLVLFFGWFGFNGGSTLGAVGQGELIGLVLLNTTVAGSAGALSATAVNWWANGKPDPGMMGNGALAGLVGITAGPDLATGGWAFLVGIVCGAVVVGAVSVVDRFHVDDPVGAVAVHGVCGALGTLFVGVYAAEVSIGTQLLGVVSVAGFVAVTVAVSVLAIRATLGLRVPADYEVEGLDLHEHGVAGLPDLGPSPSDRTGGPGLAPRGRPAAATE